MKPGDLVEVVCNGADRGKIGIIVGFAPEHERFHPWYRLWNVILSGGLRSIQGMNLVVISETG